MSSRGFKPFGRFLKLAGILPDSDSESNSEDDNSQQDTVPMRRVRRLSVLCLCGNIGSKLNLGDEDDQHDQGSFSYRERRLSSPPMEVLQALETSKQWNWDAFKLAQATKGHPLASLGMFFFDEANLIETYRLSQNPIKKYS